MVDMEVWSHAAGVLVVAPSPSLRQAACDQFPHAEIIGERTIRPRDLVKAMRLHQWLKNVLIFVPLLTAHAIDTTSLLTGVLAFLCFSFCASSVYLLNDLLDLANDRRHPSKCRRPFAAGLIPLKYGIALIPLLLAISLLLALELSIAFLGVLGLYYALTLGYSLWFKRKMVLDVVLLACLYGIRVVAGGVAVGVPLSVWLVAFCLFLFFSLALVKRCAELIDRGSTGSPPGRGYHEGDLPILESMATASGYLSVVVLALYINNPLVGHFYSIPELLWLICIVQLYWVSRVLVLTRRGQMHDDPVIFAVTDRTSLMCGALVCAIGVGASL
jgi:4-hydroxybenzoate polyprenyltransferase